MSRSTGSYFDKALTHTNGELVETMRYQLQGVKYDTIVGTGLSGTIFTARVAPGLGKSFAIVRKKDDRSTHSGTKVEGIVGKRWVFADDFISSGATFKRVLEMMKEHHPHAQFVGSYEYEREVFNSSSECEENYTWFADVVMGGPLYGPLTLPEMKRRYPWGPHVRTCPEGGWGPEWVDKVPLPDLNMIELDYLRSGEPSFWNVRDGLRIMSTDKRVQDLVNQVKATIMRDGRYNRYVGMRMNLVIKEMESGRYQWGGWGKMSEGEAMLRGWKNPVEPETLRNFTESVIKADEAANALLQGVEAQPYSV